MPYEIAKKVCVNHTQNLAFCLIHLLSPETHFIANWPETDRFRGRFWF